MNSISIEETAFPTFDDSQLQSLVGIAESIRFEGEQELISHDQKDYPFFVIKSGVVRIVERDVDGERLIATHGPRSFIGDVDMLTGRSSLFVAIANEQVEAFQLCSSQLRKLLNSCPSVSEMLLEAFQMRRKLLANRPFVGVRCIIHFSRPLKLMAKSNYKSWVVSTWRCLSCDATVRLLAILRFPSWPSASESVAMSTNSCLIW